jgi:predicted Zn-dependent peptidase
MLNRKQAPPVQRIEHIAFIEPEVFQLCSFVPVFWRKQLPNETSKIELHFAAGTTTHQAVVCSLCAGMLISGTPTKNALRIQRGFDALGAYYDVSISQDEAIVSLYALSSQLVAAYQWFHTCLFEACFPEKEIRELINERQQKFLVQQQKVSFIAQRQFQQQLFANTPYAQLIEYADFATVTQQGLQEVHQAAYLNGLLRVYLIGNIEQKPLQTLLDLLGQYGKGQSRTAAFEWNHQTGAIHIEQEGALQSAVRIGRPLFNKTHPDFCAFSVLNTILGDYFGSRLMSNIREDKGYTYGIGSYLVENPRFGYFVIGTEVGVNTREATFREIEHEFERLKTELIGQEELQLVQNYLLGQLLKSADGPYAMLDLFEGVQTMGLELSFYDRYIHEIKDVSPRRLQELAQTYLNWDEMLIISAG